VLTKDKIIIWPGLGTMLYNIFYGRNLQMFVTGYLFVPDRPFQTILMFVGNIVVSCSQAKQRGVSQSTLFMQLKIRTKCFALLCVKD
jgi:hypothetical protein